MVLVFDEFLTNKKQKKVETIIYSNIIIKI